jgi:hypothetical protein
MAFQLPYLDSSEVHRLSLAFQVESVYVAAGMAHSVWLRCGPPGFDSRQGQGIPQLPDRLWDTSSLFSSGYWRLFPRSNVAWA